MIPMICMQDEVIQIDIAETELVSDWQSKHDSEEGIVYTWRGEERFPEDVDHENLEHELTWKIKITEDTAGWYDLHIRHFNPAFSGNEVWLLKDHPSNFNFTTHIFVPGDPHEWDNWRWETGRKSLYTDNISFGTGVNLTEPGIYTYSLVGMEKGYTVAGVRISNKDISEDESLQGTTTCECEDENTNDQNGWILN